MSESALTRAVAQLRKALDDDAREARYVETVPTRGYRFRPEVEGRGGSERPAPQPRARACRATRTRRPARGRAPARQSRRPARGRAGGPRGRRARRAWAGAARGRAGAGARAAPDAREHDAGLQRLPRLLTRRQLDRLRVGSLGAARDLRAPARARGARDAGHERRPGQRPARLVPGRPPPRLPLDAARRPVADPGARRRGAAGHLVRLGAGLVARRPARSRSRRSASRPSTASRSTAPRLWILDAPLRRRMRSRARSHGAGVPTGRSRAPVFSTGRHRGPVRGRGHLGRTRDPAVARCGQVASGRGRSTWRCPRTAAAIYWTGWERGNWHVLEAPTLAAPRAPSPASAPTS